LFAACLPVFFLIMMEDDNAQAAAGYNSPQKFVLLMPGRFFCIWGNADLQEVTAM